MGKLQNDAVSQWRCERDGGGSRGADGGAGSVGTRRLFLQAGTDWNHKECSTSKAWSSVVIPVDIAAIFALGRCSG